MDPIEAFVKANRKFSFSLLINIHSRLCVLQLSKGSILYDDIMQSLALSARDMTAQELNAHAALVYEAVLTPMINAKNQMVLQLKQDVIANDPNFVKSILYVLYARAGGMDNPAVEEFKSEATLFLKSSTAPAPLVTAPSYPLAPKLCSGNAEVQSQFPSVAADSYGPATASGATAPSSLSRSHSTQSYNERFSNQAGKYPPSPATYSNNSNSPNATRETAVAAVNMGEDVIFKTSQIEFEKSEPIIRLLAQVRKVGMDILFPQSTHDKILAAIFVVIKFSATAAHRELIDMVMSLKESNCITQLETVSKTKVRGVLALLKHGEMLITQGSDGEPVRLFLSNGIETFKDLRDRHDVFIMRYMKEHHLFIPQILKSELVWTFDEETTKLRLEAVDKLMSKIDYFYSSLAPSPSLLPLPPASQQSQSQQPLHKAPSFVASQTFAHRSQVMAAAGRDDSYGFPAEDTRSKSSVFTEMTYSDSMSMRSFNDDYRYGASGYDNHHRGSAPPPSAGGDYQPPLQHHQQQQSFQIKNEQDWAALGRRSSSSNGYRTYGVSPYGQRYQNGGGSFNTKYNQGGGGGHYAPPSREHSLTSYPAHLGSHSGSHSHSHHSNHSNYSYDSNTSKSSSSYHQLSQYPPLPPQQPQGEGGYADRYSGGGVDRYGGGQPPPSRSSRHQPPVRSNALSASAAAFRPDYHHENFARSGGMNEGMFMHERERSMQREPEYYPPRNDDGYGGYGHGSGMGSAGGGGGPSPSLAAYSRSHSSQGARSGESFHRDSSISSFQRDSLSGSFYEGMAGLGGGGGSNGRGLSASGFGDEWQHTIGPGDTLGGRMLSAISEEPSPATRHPSSLAFNLNESASTDFFSMHQLTAAVAASNCFDAEAEASHHTKIMPAGLLGSLEPEDDIQEVRFNQQLEGDCSVKLSAAVPPGLVKESSYAPPSSSANIDSIIG